MFEPGDVDSVYRSLRRKSAPLLLLERAERTPDQVAYRAKKLGIYRERTWAQFRDRVARCQQGLKALGLEPGERVAIMGDAQEEWTIADLAAQAAGAVTYGIYPTASASEVEYQMKDGGAAVFVAEDQEYVDKILPLLERLPALRWVVVVDTTAMFVYDHPKLKTYDEILEQGRKALERDAAAFERDVRAIKPEDPAFIIYTSGTTGPPKGALISHGKHLAATYTFVAHYPFLASEEQRTVIYLPLGHVLGRDVAITLPLMSWIVPHYGEDIEDLPLTLFEVAPTILFTVPRYLQKFAAQVLVGIENTTPLKRMIYRAALGFGRRYARRRWEGRPGPGATALYRLLHALAFRPILNKLGFDQLRLVLSGGAPLSPATMALWQIHGVSVAEIYGMTETGGAIISGQRADFPRPGDVGTVPAGWRVELDRAGVILVKGEDLFEGYWGNPEATAEMVDTAGWLHTGDVGAWDGDRLRIIDRARDFMVTSGGKSLSPTLIENGLRASPYVSEAVVYGDGRNYLTALIEIEYDTVADWARRRNIAYTGFTSLAENARIHDLMRDEIEKANADLARVEQIKAFRILPKLLDPEEEGEPVTPTRKVKRQLMYERFKPLVESMYSGAEEALIAGGVGDALEGLEASSAPEPGD
jgi:long-chain acyl-CoA synthetase